MTDLEKLEQLLEDFKIESETQRHEDKGISVTIWGGYGGFFTDIDFDKDGNFLKWGAYE